MSLEAYTGKISDLVDSNPTPTDPKSQGDDHLRGIKYTLKQSFPNFTGPTTQLPGQLTPTQLTVGNHTAPNNNFNIVAPGDGTMIIERADGTDLMKFLSGYGVNMPTLPFSLDQNGYMTLPNGLIVQWGLDPGNAGDHDVVYPIPFPNSVLSVIASARPPTPVPGTSAIVVITTVSASPLSRFYAQPRYSNNGPQSVALEAFYWIAIGY